MSATPRTDAKVVWCDSSERDNGDFWPQEDFIAFARSLELECSTLKTALEEAEKAVLELTQQRTELIRCVKWSFDHDGECLGDHPTVKRAFEVALEKVEA